MKTIDEQEQEIEATLRRAARHLASRGSEYLEHPVLEQHVMNVHGARGRHFFVAVTAAAALCVTALAGSFIGGTSSGKVQIVEAMSQSVTPVAASLPLMSLPDNAKFMGLAPECRELAPTEFECTIEHFSASAKVADMTGYVNFFVDYNGRVSGGCRVVNPSGTKMMCYTGKSAVDHEIVGPRFLGQYVPTGGGEG